MSGNTALQHRQSTILGTGKAYLALIALSCLLQLIQPAYALATEQTQAAPTSDYEQLNLFSDVLHLIKRHYVTAPSMDILVQGAISGMLAELDPHSSYLTPEMYAELEIETSGEFNGLGIEITVQDHMITVIAPIADTPADRAGIKAGDKIIQINNKFIKDISISDAVTMMRGPVGESITLSVVRSHSNQPLEFTLQREVIHVDSIKSQLFPAGLGYIRIVQFQEHTSSELNKALAGLTKRNGKPLQGLILDLRNNPGGLLEQAVKVSDMFLDSGEIVSTRGRQEKDNFTYRASNSGSTAPNYPIVILINGGSASAAEIVAGALQDHKRAIVLGTQSFGKGSVQSVIPLEDGSALRLTTASYYTPNGISIQARGITPDIKAPQATWAVAPEDNIREQDLDNHLAASASTENISLSATDKYPATPAQAMPDQDDYQLTRAVDLLHGWQQMGQLTYPAVKQ
ncbi:MAG: S41 family peptidase [Desulfuromonas sp.]|nr:S41 family peptidase [Desulfuromonas sp.]